MSDSQPKTGQTTAAQAETAQADTRQARVAAEAPRLSGRLSQYGLAAGAAGVALSPAANAWAERVPYDPPEGLPIVVDSVMTRFEVDLDDDGDSDFVLTYDANSYGGQFVLSALSPNAAE